VAKKEQAKRDERKAAQSERFDPVRFLRETKQELDKVVWPSRQQLISESAAVIAIVTLVATLIYLFDGFFGWIAGRIY